MLQDRFKDRHSNFFLYATYVSCCRECTTFLISKGCIVYIRHFCNVGRCSVSLYDGRVHRIVLSGKNR